MTRRLLLALVIGCSRPTPPPAASGAGTLLEQARARPSPSRVVSRLSVHIRQDGSDVGPSTGGAVILDRPGRGHVAVMGPLGGPLLTVQTEGTGVAVASVRHRRHLVATDAERVIRQTTGDLVGVDDVLGLLVGDLPLDLPVLGERRLPDGDLEVTFGHDGGSRAVAVIDDPTAVPVSLVVTDAAGAETLRAAWQPFESEGSAPPAPIGADGAGLPAAVLLLPTEVALDAPRLGLEVRLQYKSWTFPAVAPEVFGLTPPEGFTTGPLELAATDALGALVREIAGDADGG